MEIYKFAAHFTAWHAIKYMYDTFSKKLYVNLRIIIKRKKYYEHRNCASVFKKSLS